MEFKGTRFKKPVYVVDRSLIRENVGIKETVEFLNMAEGSVLLLGKALSGKLKFWQVWKIRQVWKLWGKIKAGFDGMGGIPKELLDLDAEEKPIVQKELGDVLRAFMVGYFKGGTK